MLLRRFEKQLDVDMEKSASDSGFLKFTGYDIVFQEVPGEVSLALNLSRCPFRCPACHSPYLRENVGEVLDEKALSALLEKYGRTVTCVCFMGGDAEPEAVARLAAFVHRDYPGLKTAWYSGRESFPRDFRKEDFDYVKIGPYREALGGLRSPATNQRFYKMEEGRMEDITSVFWKKPFEDF